MNQKKLHESKKIHENYYFHDKNKFYEKYIYDKIFKEKLKFNPNLLKINKLKAKL